MNMYRPSEKQDIVEGILEMMEKDTGKKVFTIRVLGDTDGNEHAIDVIVVFKDQCIMMGHLIAEKIQGKLAIRVQGDFI